MTNLPFLLQTTNFLSQSICTNIPPHQSPGARTSFHYLCNTDCNMKQKLTTANSGLAAAGNREQMEGSGGVGDLGAWGEAGGSWEQKASMGSTQQTEVQEICEVVKIWKETTKIS